MVHADAVPADKTQAPRLHRQPAGCRASGGPLQRFPCSCRCFAPPSSPQFARQARPGAAEQDFGRRVQQALGFTAANPRPSTGVDDRSRDEGRSRSTPSGAVARHRAIGCGPTRGAVGDLPIPTWRSWAWSARITWGSTNSRLTRLLSRAGRRRFVSPPRTKGSRRSSYFSTRFEGTGGHSRRAGAGRGRRHC